VVVHSMVLGASVTVVVYETVVVTGSEYAPPVGVKVLVMGIVCTPFVEQNVDVTTGVGHSEEAAVAVAFFETQVSA
jgi:hypothetical protein